MKNIKDPIDLKTLVGPHTLSGCDISTEQVLDWGETHVSAGVIRFILDGKTYEAVEDPDDGYRSSLEGLHLADPDKVVNNVFPPVDVMARHLDKEDYDLCDILELLNPASGQKIMRVGTDGLDNYYPGCIMEFNPETL